MNFTEAEILVVDDLEANRTFLSRLLGTNGFKNVVPLKDSAKVASMVAAKPPDLILLDLHMPKPDGFDVLRQIEQLIPANSFLPVLVLTADDTSETKRKALGSGATDFLSKPLDATEVLLRVRNLLQTRDLHNRLERHNDLLEARVRQRTLQLEESRIEILERLATAAEYRDDETGEHTRRVGESSGRLAAALGMNADEVELIRRAATLHDLGKIGIPDEILLKPGRLTGDEFEVMKTHTTIGASILSGGTSPLLELAEEIALSHHEKFDGSGYPEGLAETSIPISGRIVAVADVYDALTHERPYKGAMPSNDALAEIRRGDGSHFDPALVELVDVISR